MRRCLPLCSHRSSEVLTSPRRLRLPKRAPHWFQRALTFEHHRPPSQPNFHEATTCSARHEPVLQWPFMAKRKDDVAESGEDSTSIKAKRVKTDKPHGLETPNSTARREKLVKDTNALTGEQFEARFVDEDMLSYVAPGKDAQEAFDISLVAADWLTPGEHNASYGIVEETSRPDYESSTFGWHPRRKRKEMLEPEMKYFFVRRKGAKPTIERTKSGDLDTSILGFLSCMVTHDSSPSVPVLYIYEIHLKETLRGLGLGKHLMRIADQLAENVGLEKVMLTCFLCNEKAHRFYNMHGFDKDVCSPEDRRTRNKLVPVDYIIMSKDSPRNSIRQLPDVDKKSHSDALVDASDDESPGTERNSN